MPTGVRLALVRERALLASGAMSAALTGEADRLGRGWTSRATPPERGVARTRFRLGLVVWSAVVAVANAAWVVVFRPDNGIALDEARLLVVAHRFADALADGDLGGLVRAWTGHEVTAPLLGLLAAPFLLVIDDPAVAGALPVTMFSGLLVYSSAELAALIGDHTAGRLTAIATSVGFGFVLWGRTHEQIVPGAALWVLAIVFLLRSDGLERAGWRRVAGVTLGIALLMRAMLVGFVPVLLVVYALHCRRRGNLRIGPWAELIAICTVVASTWWGFQWRSALGYLGPRGVSSGAAPLGPMRLGFEVISFTFVGFVVSVVAMAVLIGASVRVLRGRSRMDLAEPRVFVGLVALATFLLLVVIAEEFSGFQVLVAPLAFAVAASVAKPRSSTAHRVAFWSSAAASVVLAALPGAAWATFVDSSDGLTAKQLRTLVRGPDEQRRAAAGVADSVVIGASDRLPSGTRFDVAVYGDQHFENAHLFEASARLGIEIPTAAVDSGQPAPTDVAAAWPDVGLIVTYEVDGCTYQALDVCELDRRLAASGWSTVDRWHVRDGREARLWKAP